MSQKQRVPIIADGAVKFSGDVAKAIAAGADSVYDRLAFAGRRKLQARDLIQAAISKLWGMGSTVL